MEYNCRRCLDNGYIIRIWPKVYYATSYAEPQESIPCTHCNKGKQFKEWKMMLLANPNMSNDFDAWYQKNSTEGYIV